MSYVFRCFDCGARAYLIRGSCEWCEPELHVAKREQRRTWDAVFSRYQRDTGLEPLADWDAFERWCEVAGAI
jgi:hypothetical protein